MNRAANILIAGFVVLLSLPLWLVIALWIKVEDGGTIFFRQERAGLRGRTFRIFKFRTMVEDAEQKGLGLNISGYDDRITGIGRFLRRWSLDELPQFLNVIAGDMNLVGPRPALPFQIRKYTPTERRRLEVRPGLTGWAQVNGRNALSWKEKIRADVWYVDHRSWSLDLRILLRTPAAVLDGGGLYEKDAGLEDDYNEAETPPGNGKS